MVTEQERALIEEKMKLANIRNMRAYLLKMAVDGRVVHVELESVKEMNRLLSNATNNINQIAKRANETGNVYDADLNEIKVRQDEIWVQQKEILRKISKMIDAVK